MRLALRVAWPWAALVCAARAVAAVAVPSSEYFEFSGLKRNFTLFVPESAPASAAPLLVLLHGSYGSGDWMVRQWLDVATREGVILAAPDARKREAWLIRADGPQFLRALVAVVERRQGIDRRRIYLFGSSGGAVYALTLSMVESEFFAATAVHAGAWRTSGEFAALKYARRNVRVAIFIGDKDEYFPLFAVRRTQHALEEAGHFVSVEVIPGHTHAYDQVAAEVSRSAWEFLKVNQLDAAAGSER